MKLQDYTTEELRAELKRRADLVKEERLVPTCELKDGDILSYQTVRFATEEEKQKLFQAIKDNRYKWDAQTKTLKKLVKPKPKPKFKVGDKIVNRVNMYMGDLSHQDVISEITEDKYILKDGGYIHIKDQGIWELASDKKEKFDPKTLKEFDKVLVKDDGDWIWRVDIISVPADYNDNIPYLIGDNDFDWIIPYNEETKHLVGTHEEAPEYYRYWED